MRDQHGGLDQTSLLREIYRSVANLQSQSERAFIEREKRRELEFRANLLAFMESTDRRLASLETKVSRPMVDLTSLWNTIGFKIVLLLCLAGGNPIVIEWAKLALTK